jgi:hypothetical protein
MYALPTNAGTLREHKHAARRTLTPPHCHAATPRTQTHVVSAHGEVLCLPTRTWTDRVFRSVAAAAVGRTGLARQRGALHREVLEGHCGLRIIPGLPA